MNSPNAATALERLENEWRKRWAGAHMTGDPQIDAITEAYIAAGETCADELATLRATLAQEEAVATTSVGDPEDEGGGPWFSLADWKRLRELPPHTKLFTHPAPVAQQEAVAWQQKGPYGWHEISEERFNHVVRVAAKHPHAKAEEVRALYTPAPVAHSPAGVDEAMVERACVAFWSFGSSGPPWNEWLEDWRCQGREEMRAALTAALNPAAGSEGSP